MKKNLLMAATLLLSTRIFCQVTYTVERFSPDSIFLTERIETPINGSPRKQQVSTSLLLKSEADLQKVFDGLISAADTAEKDYTKAVQEVEQIRTRAEMARTKANAARVAMKSN